MGYKVKWVEENLGVTRKAFGLFYDRIISIEGSPFVLGKECLLCQVKERITKAVSYTTASISSQTVAIVTNIMMAPARLDIYIAGDWIKTSARSNFACRVSLRVSGITGAGTASYPVWAYCFRRWQSHGTGVGSALYCN